MQDLRDYSADCQPHSDLRGLPGVVSADTRADVRMLRAAFSRSGRRDCTRRGISATAICGDNGCRGGGCYVR
jgi:hypothetical protein